MIWYVIAAGLPGTQHAIHVEIEGGLVKQGEGMKARGDSSRQ
jgi:hypothetical protein